MRKLIITFIEALFLGVIMTVFIYVLGEILKIQPTFMLIVCYGLIVNRWLLINYTEHEKD